MAKPQFNRDASGQFAPKTTLVKPPRPVFAEKRRFGRLHSAIQARKQAEKSLEELRPTVRTPAYDDMYDLYSNYDN